MEHDSCMHMELTIDTLILTIFLDILRSFDSLLYNKYTIQFLTALEEPDEFRTQLNLTSTWLMPHSVTS